MKRHKYNREEIKKACLRIIPTIPIQERYAYNIFIRIRMENKIQTDHTNVYKTLKTLTEEGYIEAQNLEWTGSGRFRHIQIYHLTFKGERTLREQKEDI